MRGLVFARPVGRRDVHRTFLRPITIARLWSKSYRFSGLPGRLFVLVVGRSQSEPDLALSAPKFSERALASMAMWLNVAHQKLWGANVAEGDLFSRLVKKPI